MTRRPRTLLALLAATAGAVTLAIEWAASLKAEPAANSAPKWLEDPGTAVLGMGLLRVAPSKASEPGSIRIRYQEKPGDYAAFDSVQLMVLPGDAFALDGRCFADRAVAFAHSDAGGDYEVEVAVPVNAPALLVVGFGPFFGPDTGRPLTLAHALTLEVKDAKGATWRWVDEQAGELNVKGWTNRPDVKRGGPVRHAAGSGDGDLWFEVRPLVIYDRERVKGPGDPETAETLSIRKESAALVERAKALREQKKFDAAAELEAEAADLLSNAAASDERLPVPAATAERFHRLPFRWK